MHFASVYEAKTNLSNLLKQVEEGRESVIITRHGRPVAELRPIHHRSRLVVDPTVAEIRIDYDPTAPTEEEWGSE